MEARVETEFELLEEKLLLRPRRATEAADLIAMTFLDFLTKQN